MEGRNRPLSGVVKNRNSSGCLIIKKKADGVSRAGTVKGSKLHESKKEKKRLRMNEAESLSSDDEFIELYQKRGVPSRNHITGASIIYENDYLSLGRNGMIREGVSKRSKLDVYDFNEYDDLSDFEMMRMRHYHDRGMGSEAKRFMPGMKKEFESKGDIIYTRRNSFRGVSSTGKIKGADINSGNRRFEMRNGLQASMGKGKIGGSDDAIRLQGKNGVLKVKVKHKEDISEQFAPSYVHVKGDSVAPRSQELTSKNIVIHSSPSSEKNMSKRPMPVDRSDKNQQRKRKTENSEESDEEAENGDSPLRLQCNSVQVQRSTKRGKCGGSTQSPQTAQPIKLKEGKVKRGSGTEKQLLREKIRTMLIDAGWTIDYRPRRGRDYFDAVYVNPTGTAYWSIIKAYDALQKQLEEEGNNLKASEDCSSFTPISEDVLSKLTRKTRKKIEKELKRKKDEDGGKRKKDVSSGYQDADESDTDSGGSDKGDGKLSSLMKRRGKGLKGASRESCRDVNISKSRMQDRVEKSSSMSNGSIHARKSKKIGRCMLLVRKSGKGINSETEGFIPYTGKRNLLSWLIDCGTVKLSEKVHYMNHRCTRVLLEGWITRDGIHCGCCSKILTVPKFELHAGSKLRQPYQNIYLISGTSLMQCLIDAWNRQEESLSDGHNKIDVNGDDPNDDTCAVCGDGGNLICCDSCPSTFHQSCLGIEMLPPGDWHCPHCSCKFCGLADMNVIEDSDRRLDSVLTCCLCERKYHCLCVEETDVSMTDSSSNPFCGRTCQELSERLQKLLGVKHELEEGLFWSIIHRVDIGSDSSVRGFSQRVEWNSKLAVALNVMDECFLPINDRRSGINIIHSVLYNSGANITRLNYSGFYTAILEKGDEIVSAASIRLHGTEFAEMPFIGTRHIYRRQGMCRHLFSGIESALGYLKVEKLIIPAICELMDTWTTVFGFCTLKESDKQMMKVGNILVFPGIDMLQKELYAKNCVKKGSEGAESFEKGSNASIIPKLIMDSKIDSSPGPASAGAEMENEVINDKFVADFGSEDTVHTAKHGASDCHEQAPSLPIKNEEMVGKSISDFAGGDAICTDGTSLHRSSADCFKEVEHCLATENDPKNKASDTGFEDVACKEKSVVRTPLPTVYEEMKDKSISDLCSEQMLCEDENLLPNASTDFCEEVKPSLPIASPNDCNDNKSTRSEKCKSVGKTSEQAVSADENSLPNASADCWKEAKPCFTSTSLHDCIDNMSVESEYMKDKCISSTLTYCHEEVTHMSIASPHDSNDTKLPSQDVIHEANVLVSNGGCMRITNSEVQSDVKFNEYDIDVKHQNFEDKSTDTHETGNVLDNSDAKYNMEASFDAKMIQGANVAVALSGSSPTDDEMIEISSVNEAQSRGYCGESKDDSLPDTSPAETDDCFGLQSLHVSEYINIDSAHELKMDDVSRNDILCSEVCCPIIEAILVDDVTFKTSQNASDSIASVENYEHEPPIIEGEVNRVEVTNDQPITKSEHSL